jgi:hypothetical protein
MYTRQNGQFEQASGNQTLLDSLAVDRRAGLPI